MTFFNGLSVKKKRDFADETAKHVLFFVGIFAFASEDRDKTYSPNEDLVVIYQVQSKKSP